MRALLILVIVKMVTGDIYIHNPRGSNNRNNENTANRHNANRLFNSQVRLVKMINWMNESTSRGASNFSFTGPTVCHFCLCLLSLDFVLEFFISCDVSISCNISLH